MNDLVCLFRVEPNRISIKKAAEMIAAESSTGTWTKVPKEKKKLRAKVINIKGKYVKISYSQELFEPGNMPQILSSIAGNIFGMKSIRSLKLEDIKWPSELMKSFPGPKFGIKGVRKLLKISKRPLVGSIIKPKIGLNEKEHSQRAYQTWIGGIDIVKDDENLSSLSFNRFEKRIIETLKMRNKAQKQTGEKKIYMPNVTAETNEMLKRAKFVKKQGGEYIMIDIITTGWAGLQTLRNANLNLVIHAHRAGHAAFTRGDHGISMLVIADIARLIGVDQLHIGALAKMVGESEEVKHIGEEIEKKFIKKGKHTLSENWHNMKPIFAVCSGGLHPGHVPKLVKTLGKDIIIQAGGGVHGHPLGSTAGAKAMRQAVEATMKNISLKEYAKKNKELKLALNKWR
jgi:ribulose-bisphosphate carboxylase large chain